ncbi:unnamed protein product, partial [marine sediment metagenome]
IPSTPLPEYPPYHFIKTILFLEEEINSQVPLMTIRTSLYVLLTVILINVGILAYNTIKDTQSQRTDRIEQILNDSQ